MAIQKLTIFNFDDIKHQAVSIKHHNAFIFPDGKFCLADGYKGSNSSQQLEKSALQISKEIIGLDIRAQYEINMHYQMQNSRDPEDSVRNKFYFLRNILIHYYGYALFARIQRMDVCPQVENFWDSSIIPDPKYCGKTVTESQLLTLKALFELNDDGTLLPSLNESEMERNFEKILKQGGK